MATQSPGRHRVPGRFNPVSEISGIVAHAAQPAVKTSAVIAASSGLVASFAFPASAAPANPALGTPAATSAAPNSVQAPKTATPQAPDTFGIIGFTVTAKPKPKPARHFVAQTQPQRTQPETVSRSAEREPLKPATRPAAEGVLGVAASLAGIMYYYGGTSPDTGFDCSGFTQYVFDKVGISLPRTAEEQRRFVTPVANPQPGDLVFFGAPAYHMGIYAGNGKMWDSPRTGKAVALRDIWSTSVTFGRP